MGDGMALRSKSTSVLAAETSSSYFPNYSASPLASLPSWFAYHPASSPVASTMLSKKSMLQNGLVSSWLEAMRAASPPRREKKCDHHNDRKKLGLDDGYMDWVAKHPSALNLFKEIMGAAKERQVALFLDYDGTLSPIVEDPECAFMSSEMRAVVKKVATHFPTSIISGRSRDKVYEFVQLTGLYYAGSHGMDIMGPAVGCNGYKIEGVRSYDEEGNEVVLFQPASEFLPMMNEVYKALEERAQYIEGAKIEHNKFCVSIHFRRVKEEKWHILAEEVEDVLKKYPRLFLTQGRKVLELRPSIEWDKGKAVDYLLTALGLGNSDVLPVYIGDDRTDEDAFAVLNEKLNGYSILVSNVAKATGAKFSLRDPSEVMDFLNCLVKWKQDHHIIS